MLHVHEFHMLKNHGRRTLPVCCALSVASSEIHARATSRVRFNLVPEVFSVPCDSPNPMEPRSFTELQKHVDKNDLFVIFYSNISSLSIQARNFIFGKEMASVHSLALVETHKTDRQFVENMFRKHHRTPYVNPALKTSATGSHGGEVIANLAHLNSMPIEQSIFDNIRDYTQEPICFAACTIRLKGLTFLLVVPYLVVGEGMSPRNSQLIGQIDLLRRAVGLPFISIGDFNMLDNELM